MKKQLDQGGFSLITVMVASALMGIVMLGLLQLAKTSFLIQRSSAQANELASTDFTVRSLLTNNTACANTFNGFTNSGSWETLTIKDPSGNPVLANGHTSEGVTINTIQAKGGALTGGVALVEVTIDLNIEKAVLAARAKSLRYFINLAISGGVVKSCLLKSGSGMVLTKYEVVDLPITGSAAVRTLYMQDPTNPTAPGPTRHIAHYANMPVTNNNFYNAPTVTVTAEGNMMIITARTDGAVSDTGQGFALWGTAFFRVDKAGGGALQTINIGSWPAGQSSTATSPPVMIDTDLGDNYVFYFRGNSNRPGDPSPAIPITEHQSVNFRDPTLYIYHYVK